MRVPYDSLTLLAVAGETRRALSGGIVQHISQPTPTDLVLSVRQTGATIQLLLSCDAVHPRAYLTSVKRANPKVPPTFCMSCRKHLMGARVLRVEQREFDRILEIEFQDREGGAPLLVAELMGKHSNLILLREDGVITDAAKRISSRQNRHREVLPGKRYVEPPAAAGRQDPFSATPEQIDYLARELPSDLEAASAMLQSRFRGLSPFLAMEIAGRAARETLRHAWAELFAAAVREDWSPTLFRNERGEPVGAYPFASSQISVSTQHSRTSVCTALDHYYSVSILHRERDAARRQLASEIDRALTAKRKQTASVQGSLAEATRAEEFKETGELLLAHLHEIAPEAAKATVTDFYKPETPTRVIELDPMLSGQENADLWFRRYRKARDGAQRLEEQSARIQQEISDLELARDRAAECADQTALIELRRELASSHLLRTPQDPAQVARRAEVFAGKKIRSMMTPEGWEVLIGENSEANDYLTTRIAVSNDIWLHVRANSSAHVVIRTRNQPQSVPPAVLRLAAELAARHSAAKHSSVVPVDYTLRKHVRKPRGAAPGAVQYQNEKTIYVSPKD